MSTKCSSGAVPGGVLVNLSRTPGEAQRSGFAGKRRSKGAVAVFAVRRKRRQADFATTSRHGQSNSPPAGGETPREMARRVVAPHARKKAVSSSPPHPPPSGAPSPIPSVAARHLPLIRGVGPQGKAFGRPSVPSLRRATDYWGNGGSGKPLPYGFSGSYLGLGRGAPWGSRRQRTRRRWLENLGA